MKAQQSFWERRVTAKRFDKRLLPPDNQFDEGASGPQAREATGELGVEGVKTACQAAGLPKTDCAIKEKKDAENLDLYFNLHISFISLLFLHFVN